MATFCPKHGSSTKAVLPESENPAGRRRRDVPAILQPSNFIWGGDVLGHQLTYLAGGGEEGGPRVAINPAKSKSVLQVKGSTAIRWIQAHGRPEAPKLVGEGHGRRQGTLTRGLGLRLRLGEQKTMGALDKATQVGDPISCATVLETRSGAGTPGRTADVLGHSLTNPAAGIVLKVKTMAT